MLHTVLLRFGDLKCEDTISAHTRVITRRDHVWWGWWRRGDEIFPSSQLKSLKKKCPFEIGLFNRNTKRYFVANCEEIKFTSDGKKIKTPDASSTPSYYASDRWPVWFKLSSITEISEDDFKSQFGNIPNNENISLFIVDKLHDTINVRKGIIVFDPTRHETTGDSILHLSDLHFGEFHRFPKITATDPIIEYPVFEKIKHYLDAEVERKIGVLVITGDLVSKGSEKDFRFVERFIENIRLYLNIEKNKVIIIPGNHDMWTADVPETELLEFKHEQAFRDFIRLYYSDGTNTIEKIHRFITPAGWNLNIIGLHSVHCRQVITREYGYIGNSADYLFEKITEENGERSTAQLTSDRILNLALMHHHIISPPFILKPDGERPLSVTLDAGSLINLFCNAKIRFVIHGHNHFPYIGTVQSSNVKGEWKLDQFPLNIICGGSCGVKEAYLRDEFKHNTFGIYTPLETGLHIDVVKYNPTEEPERYAHYLIPY